MEDRFVDKIATKFAEPLLQLFLRGHQQLKTFALSAGRNCSEEQLVAAADHLFLSRLELVGAMTNDEPDDSEDVRVFRELLDDAAERTCPPLAQ